MKHSIDARVAKPLCMNCGSWKNQILIKDPAEEPECENCHSRLLTLLYFSQDADKLVEIYGSGEKAKNLRLKNSKTSATPDARRFDF